MTCLILLRGEISKRLLSHFMVCSVLTFVGDMFDGNMAVLVECHNFHLSACGTESGLRTMFYQIFTDDGWNFPLICRRACRIMPA